MRDKGLEGQRNEGQRTEGTKDWRTMENGVKGIMGSKGQRIWDNGGRREL